MGFTYEHARPALTVDCVVFAFGAGGLEVLLIRRGKAPFLGSWAIPGGFVEPGESLDEAARRELCEETGMRDVFLEQLYTFGAPDRDPREHVVSVAYYALVDLSGHEVQAGSDAAGVAWFGVGDVPRLAFDHGEILEMALERLRNTVRHRPVVFELLPRKFTLRQLQELYESILERPLDKRNFRKKMFKMDILVDLGEVEQGVAHRAARLYRFDRRKYRKLERGGGHFEL